MTMTTAAFSDDTDHAEIRFLVEKNADGIIVVDDEGIVQSGDRADFRACS
jgi:hypothetical protein